MSDRDRLIELIQNAVNGCARHWAEIIADYLLANGVTVQEWISVKDRLPEDDLLDDNTRKTVKCLVAIKAKNGVTVRTQMRFKDHTYKDGKRKEYWRWKLAHGDVTHWMPLPPPPKGSDT